MGRQRCRGAALITVLLILAVMVMMAAGMSSRLSLEVRRAINIHNHSQAYWYALAAEEFAKHVLRQNASDSKRVHLNQSWAKAGLVFPLPDGGKIAGTLKDLQSCFNLNALTVDNDRMGRPPWIVYQFRALLEAMDMDSYRAEIVTDSIRNWVRHDATPVSGVGATDRDYEDKSPAYLSAHGPMVHVSELRAIAGIDASLYRRLRPLVCTLPLPELHINMNTLSMDTPALLQALFTPGLTREQALSLLARRPTNGYESVLDFLAENELERLEIKPEVKGQLTVTSRFFQLSSTTESQSTLFRMESVLERISDKQVNTLTRQFGGEQ